jgi:hypothetical protein
VAQARQAGYVTVMLARQPTDPAEIDTTAQDAEDDVIMAEVEREGGISHAAIMRWVRSWGTPGELPPPEVGD